MSTGPSVNLAACNTADCHLGSFSRLPTTSNTARGDRRMSTRKSRRIGRRSLAPQLETKQSLKRRAVGRAQHEKRIPSRSFVDPLGMAERAKALFAVICAHA